MLKSSLGRGGEKFERMGRGGVGTFVPRTKVPSSRFLHVRPVHSLGKGAGGLAGEVSGDHR